MEIGLDDVWESRLKTMADIRGTSEAQVIEEALLTLYFMVIRDDLVAKEAAATTSD